MNRTFVRAAAAAAIAGLLLIAGCTAEPESHPTDGVWGYVASARDAALEVTTPQDGADGTLTVDRVLAPGDAWVVVHLDDNGAPGMRVGLAPVPEGESRDITVDLEGELTDSLIVAIHADKGTAGEFDFSMDDPTGSPDRPYFVDGAELATVVALR